MKTPGLVVPPLTPFKDDLSVDFEVLCREVDYIVEDCGALMVSAAGVETTEYHFLTFDERCELIRQTVDFVDKRIPVVVGVSHANIHTAIGLAHMAQDIGAHAIQVLAPLRPFGGAPTLDDLLAYFNAIAAETDLPIMLYLNPGPGAEVSPAWTLELAKLDQVKFVKESSRDLARVSRLIEEIDHGGHAHYFTTMQMLLASIQLGGSGATMPPPGAFVANAIITAFNAGDHVEAARLQRQFALWPQCELTLQSRSFYMVAGVESCDDRVGYKSTRRRHSRARASELDGSQQHLHRCEIMRMSAVINFFN